VKPNIQPPSLFKVIYINDSVTTMEFVVESLMSVFNHSADEATRLTQLVHEEGAAVVAILPYELAEQKGMEVTLLARNNGFPLAIRLEPAV
ncbi:MAG: ATP-dependent Clp protease adaptor ClpS, partial [Shewanella vesiculosa]|uniref:ATP-dependent Clp protease adaptor ClpS n=1 Tax=Shewanella vesiculosa TaxID=518738 RepID=UPI001D4A6BB5